MIIKVCTGKSCSERFSPYIMKRLLADKTKYDTENKSLIEECGCQGLCKNGPTVVMDTAIVSKMNPVKASNLYLEKLLKKKPSA